MRARSNTVFVAFSLFAIVGLAVGIGWSKRTKADEPSASTSKPDVLYSDLAPTPKPAQILNLGPDATMTLEQAALNSQQSKESADEVIAWANRDRDKVHAAWGEYGKQMSTMAVTREAEYASGLAGHERLGVR